MKRYQWEKDQMQHMKVSYHMQSHIIQLQHKISCLIKHLKNLVLWCLLHFGVYWYAVDIILDSITILQVQTRVTMATTVDHIMFCPQDYIARFGHGSAKLARQAQSKEKVLAKMVASGLTEKVVTDKVSIQRVSERESMIVEKLGVCSPSIVTNVICQHCCLIWNMIVVRFC